MRFVKTIGLLLTLFLSGCTGKNSVIDLYKFSSTKDVEVQVNIAFKLDDSVGPTIDLTGKTFILNAFALDANGQQVQLAPSGSEPVYDLDITLPGTQYTFDSTMRIPVAVQPRDNGGYALRFELREKGIPLVLQNANDSTLSALRGDVQAGVAAATNKVDLTLATSLAAKLIRSSISDPGNNPALTAYDELVNILKTRLQTVEASADAGKNQSISVFASALSAALKYQVMTDKALQNMLTDKIVAANQTLTTEAERTKATETLASGFTESLIEFAREVKSRLGDNTTNEFNVFPSGSMDPLGIPEPSEYASAVFAPLAISFTDTDSSASIGGSIVITAPIVSTGITSYNIYFGANLRSQSKISLAGNAASSASPLALNLPAGTAVPANATKFWIYPVMSDGRELDVPAWIYILNVGGSNPTFPAAPTGLLVANGSGKNNVSWNAVSGATSYNLYWSTTSPVTTSSNKIVGASSPYVHAGIQPSVTYYYSVTAVENGFESSLSAEASVTAGTTYASAPAGLTASADSASSIRLSWTAVAGASKYDIYWSTSSGVTTASTKISNVTSPYTHTGLNPSTQYYYIITATAGGVESSASSQVSAQTSAPPAPPSPASLSTTPGSKRVRVKWQSGGAYTVGYIVVRSNAGAVTFTPTDGQTYSAGTIDSNQQLIYSGTATKTIDTGLSTTTYDYAVFAYNTNKLYSPVSRSTATLVTNMWTWVGGSSAVPPSPDWSGVSPTPGKRYEAAICGRDDTVYMFGGWNATFNGNYSDLWKFSEGQWMHLAGPTSVDAAAVWGTQGVAAEGNNPPSRYDAVCWVDLSGNLWLFGGYEDVSGQYLHDLWKWNGSAWAWIKGSSTQNSTTGAGSYGTKGVTASGNYPPARFFSSAAVDSSGNAWIFGGKGNAGEYSDLWKFDGTNWTWVAGPNTVDDSQAYAGAGPQSGNSPGAMSEMSLSIDAQGRIIVFGGRGFDTASSRNALHDLWRFDGTNWERLSGSGLSAQSGSFGTIGVTSSSNIPPAMSVSRSWMDLDGNFWNFGGNTNNFREQNALWLFDGTDWTWMKGSSSTRQSGVYGTLGTPAAGNTPGARWFSGGWTDELGRLWLVGGEGQTTSPYQPFLDMWIYTP